MSVGAPVDATPVAADDEEGLEDEGLAEGSVVPLTSSLAKVGDPCSAEVLMTEVVSGVLVEKLTVTDGRLLSGRLLKFPDLSATELAPSGDLVGPSQVVHAGVLLATPLTAPSANLEDCASISPVSLAEGDGPKALA